VNQPRKIDQDDVVRARNVLLASGRRTPREEVDAYRVLAQVSPSYLPRLVKALIGLTYDTRRGRPHEAALALSEEAVSAARAIAPDEPVRAEVLYAALDSCQRELYAVGRRTEGLAMRAEMVSLGRAQAELTGTPVVMGLSTWAAGLAEEGRYAEAADAVTEYVAVLLPQGPRSGGLAWSLVEWIATLHDAGRTDEALAALETLISMEADESANDRAPRACHLYSLIWYARMLDTCDRGRQAAAVRQDALALLADMEAGGGSYQVSFWAVLLSCSGADGERPPAGEPRPPSGATPMVWSADVKRRYFDSRVVLREKVDALAARAAEDPDGHLAELVRLQRVLTVRSAVYWEHRTHLFAERVRDMFDDGVRLARRLHQHDSASGARVLAEALIDRSTFHTAVGELGPALDDFRQALVHLGETG
jgi:tetratricopeptide (TPR) repeat protein